MKGTIEVSVSADDNKKKIVVHVIRCKNLERAESSQINAYVKCALASVNSCHPNKYERTAVHRNSADPMFDQKFIFDINDFNDYAKIIQIAVWHRNRDCKRSEFLGCLAIPVKVAIRRNINGFFLLQPQISMSAPSLLIPESGLTINNDEDPSENFCTRT